jgi:N-acetylneuraminate synthase
MSLLIIAEIGINHNGDLGIAKDLMRIAKESGVDLVKFQKRSIEKVYSADFLNEPRESPWGKTQRDQKMGLEFNEEEYSQIDLYSKELGLGWFASAWDIESQYFLRKFNCKYNKVASAMITNEPLLHAIAEEGKHTFISTGMSNLNQIDLAVDIFSKASCSFELMHCISTYPMQDTDANLLCIKTLKDRYGCNVGYSGHEVGLSISYAAVALGITSLERHVTLRRAMYGSDQAASLEPEGLRRLVGGVRKIVLAMGDGQKRIIDKEIPIAEKLRAHIKFEANR